MCRVPRRQDTERNFAPFCLLFLLDWLSLFCPLPLPFFASRGAMGASAKISMTRSLSSIQKHLNANVNRHYRTSFQGFSFCFLFPLGSYAILVPAGVLIPPPTNRPTPPTGVHTRAHTHTHTHTHKHTHKYTHTHTHTRTHAHTLTHHTRSLETLSQPPPINHPHQCNRQ